MELALPNSIASPDINCSPLGQAARGPSPRAAVAQAALLSEAIEPQAAARSLPLPSPNRQCSRTATEQRQTGRKAGGCSYRRRPRRPLFRRVLSVGVGVTSSIRPILMPERARARRAD